MGNHNKDGGTICRHCGNIWLNENKPMYAEITVWEFLSMFTSKLNLH